MATPHTHTHKWDPLLKAFVDPRVRFLFQDSIRLKSPEAQQKREGGRSEGMSVEGSRNLLTVPYCSRPGFLLELWLGDAGAQYVPVLPESRLFIGTCVRLCV